MEETYGADALWVVGIASAVVAWLAMSISEVWARDKRADEWRSVVDRERSRAVQAEKLLMQYKRSARLAQERLEEINGPKVEHAVTYKE